MLGALPPVTVVDGGGDGRGSTGSSTGSGAAKLAPHPIASTRRERKKIFDRPTSTTSTNSAGVRSWPLGRSSVVVFGVLRRVLA